MSFGLFQEYEVDIIHQSMQIILLTDAKEKSYNHVNKHRKTWKIQSPFMIKPPSKLGIQRISSAWYAECKKIYGPHHTMLKGHMLPKTGKKTRINGFTTSVQQCIRDGSHCDTARKRKRRLSMHTCIKELYCFLCTWHDHG